MQEVQGLRFSFRAHYDRGQLRLNTFGHVLAGVPCCRPIYQITIIIIPTHLVLGQERKMAKELELGNAVWDAKMLKDSAKL